ncbi:hypothetical protein KSD_34990 [Ktedonobacter sp. SOSP1-85]|uniref:DUF790 family protein n=1 Tax=Ktedonobacter sp. SOSP1-85 TaxID=2778367 RepID=UPI001915D3F3|nr:DUF790 family protein [Ktedonobacter sp. SOSP1-85]GHO75728.1 hypothetical protein KSD_34990 [Ktedonobacter sp. SOSP1-85]
MRFSLQDVKKTVHRRAGRSGKAADLGLSLHFLRPGVLYQEIEQLVAYYESMLDRPQRAFLEDEARSYIGDYRLANCLLATLSNWYQWRTREWSEVLQEMQASEALEDVTSPTRLRLALFDFVNEHYQGFLANDQRQEALQAFALTYRLTPDQLAYLLVLDSEDEAVLVRTGEQPPTAPEVAATYNQWAFEAALFNASDVHFSLDCQALSDELSADELFPMPSTEPGLGAVIKRLCFLARRFGVYYDLSYEADLVSELSGRPTTLELLLYGPQEVTGAPQQYGMRLARLCRVLLGYQKQPGRSQSFSAALVEAEATVHFLQRRYQFQMDAKLLQLLPQPARSEVAEENTAYVPTTSLFDSSIEQGFAEAFTALAASQGADGWHLEREPEPLLLAQSIFIPDFALSRGRERIYMEILGFWTPAYRERKIQKLLQMTQRKDLILAIPLDAKEAFAPIASSFPIVYYRGQLSASEVLHLLRQHFDDFALRLAQLDSASIRAHVQVRGFLLEQECYALLKCYRRSELGQATQLVVDERTRYVAGLGLYSVEAEEQLRREMLAALRAENAFTLGAFAARARQLAPVLQACDESAIEALITLWPEIYIRRDSIFEAQVELATESLSQESPMVDTNHASGEDIEMPAMPLTEPESVPVSGKKTSSGRKLDTTRAKAGRKRVASPAVQSDLWGEA